MPLVMWIIDYGPPAQAATVAPVVENNSTGKRISFRGDHNDAHIGSEMVPSAELCPLQPPTSLPLEVGEPEQKPFGKLKTEPAFPLSRVYEEIVPARRPRYFPFLL